MTLDLPIICLWSPTTSPTDSLRKTNESETRSGVSFKMLCAVFAALGALIVAVVGKDVGPFTATQGKH